MKRRQFAGAAALLLLPSLAWARSRRKPTPIPTKKPPAQTFMVPLLETMVWEAIPHKAFVNGFDSDLLISVNADDDGSTAGLETKMVNYTALHPYFLKNGENELALEYALDLSYMVDEDMGPWKLGYRVSAMEYRTEQDYGTIFKEKELLTLESPSLPKTKDSAKPRKLSGKFTWVEKVPDWDWTKAPKIEDTPANVKSLRAKYDEFWTALNGMAQKPVPAEFEQSTRASMKDFIQASEMRGKKFTFLDDLLHAATKLTERGDTSRGDAIKNRKPPKVTKIDPGPMVVVDDYTPEFIPTPLPDGNLPPNLSLQKFENFQDAPHMTLFAGGRLAKLTSGASNESLIQFYSNYGDGPWGQVGSTRLEADLWFRKNAKNEWELAAIYPMYWANLATMNDWPQELIEFQPY